MHQGTQPVAKPHPRDAVGSGHGDVCLVPIHCQPLPATVSLSHAGTSQQGRNLVQREHRQIPTGLANFSSLKQTTPKPGMFCCWNGYLSVSLLLTTSIKIKTENKKKKSELEIRINFCFRPRQTFGMSKAKFYLKQSSQVSGSFPA